MPVGDYAFYTALSGYSGFVNLITGENVPTMGKGAFHYRDIENLTYNAVSAKNANVMANVATFFGCEIGSLTIGDTVEHLDAGTFCGIKITQEEFVIPDYVKECSCYIEKQQQIRQGQPAPPLFRSKGNTVEKFTAV